MRALILALGLLSLPAAVALPVSAYAATAPVVDTAYPKGKLPDVATPVTYRLNLTIIPSKPRFSAHAEIDIKLKADTTTLYMHGRDLKVTVATATGNDGKVIKAKYTQVDPLGVVRLDFAKPVPAGAVTLAFDYDAAFGDGPAGLYRIKVGDDWYVWSQFESIDARAAFPSFDEPGYKTPFRVSITTEKGMVVASNAPQNGEVTAGKLIQHDFYPTKPLPTYLVALVVGPFVTAEGAAPPTAERNYPLPIRIIATKPNKDKLAYALAETPAIIGHLEDYFGQAFPYPKLDQIASPVMPGAMENAGADIYADNIILLDPGAATDQKQTFGMVVSHELSHQWFGDYVTPAWWDDIWLNESFANWMGYRIGNEWRPELNIGVGAIDEAFTAMGTDSLKAGRPIHQPIVNNGDIDQAFDSITYGKGGQVVAMVAAYLGDERFKAGVRLHMSRHPYGNATTEQFFGALADAAQDPRILTSMKSFIDQQGLPVVDFTHVGGYLVATQSRYARLGTTLDPQTWAIPLCIRRGEERGCFMLDVPQGNLGVDNVPGAIMPNAGGTGYYRFSLTPEDWDTLLKTGATLPNGEALAATDSLWAQFNAGKLPAGKLIDAAKLLVSNPDSSVAVDGGQRLSTLKARGIIADDATADYRRVMSSIYKPRLTALGFDPKAGSQANDTPDVQRLRSNLVDLVAGEAHDDAVRAQLKTAAAAYLGGDTTAVDQSFLGSALNIYVADGGLDAAKAVYERTMTASDELFRQSALGAITAEATPEVANWVFGQLNTDTRLRGPDRLYLIAGLMASTKSRDVTFDWYKANYETMAKSGGIFSGTRLSTLPRAYCSVDKATELDGLLRAKVIAAGRGELSFDRMLEGVRNCGIIKDAKSAELTQALKDAQ